MFDGWAGSKRRETDFVHDLLTDNLRRKRLEMLSRFLPRVTNMICCSTYIYMTDVVVSLLNSGA
jgi:hypothetical protein